MGEGGGGVLEVSGLDNGVDGPNVLTGPTVLTGKMGSTGPTVSTGPMWSMKRIPARSKRLWMVRRLAIGNTTMNWITVGYLMSWKCLNESNDVVFCFRKIIIGQRKINRRKLHRHDRLRRRRKRREERSSLPNHYCLKGGRQERCHL